jgi:DNA-binding transcriptional MerR regulator
MANESPYLGTPTVLAITGVPASTLDYWVRNGLVAPSVRASSGRRRTRRWSIRDIVAIRAIQALHQAGCPVRILTQARAALGDDWAEDLGGKHLIWDGRDLLALRPWGELESIIQSPGQPMLHLLALPVDEWAHHAHAVWRAQQESEQPTARRERHA